MISERQLRRFQLGLLLAAVGLLALFWFGYRNLAGWARQQDKPTTDTWKRLLSAAQGKPHIRALSPRALLGSVEQLQQAASLLQQAGQAARGRIELEDALRAKVAEEFQLLEFERSRWQLIAELQRAAEQKKVTLADAALKGLPEFDPDLAQPALLWVQLALARQLLATAIACEPRVVQSLTVLPIKLHASADGKQLALEEFPFRLELSGAASNLVMFMTSLPLRGGELAAAGAREVPGKNQPLFIDRFILKNTVAYPSEATLEIVTTGFCEPLPNSEARSQKPEVRSQKNVTRDKWELTGAPRETAPPADSAELPPTPRGETALASRLFVSPVARHPSL